MKKKKILFVVDWKDFPNEIKSVFKEGRFLDYEWHVYNCILFKKLNSNILERYLEYFLAVVYILINKNKYDNIVIWQQMIGFILSIFPRLKKHPKIIITTVLYSPSKVTKGSIRLFLLSRALKNSDALLYYSEDMANDVKKTFPIYANKVYSTYIPIFKKAFSSSQMPKLNYELDIKKTVFSGGRSDRDFDTVIMAFRNTDIPVVIVCPDNYEFKKLNRITNNIKILRYSEISSSESAYYAIVSSSFCVVISLQNEFSSCGQLLFSYCMENKIPIIASDCYGTRDYVKNFENGLLVPIADPKAFLDAYNILYNDTTLKQKLVNNSKIIADKMTFNNYLNKVIEIIKDENSSYKQPTLS